MTPLATATPSAARWASAPKPAVGLKAIWRGQARSTDKAHAWRQWRQPTPLSASAKMSAAACARTAALRKIRVPCAGRARATACGHAKRCRLRAAVVPFRQKSRPATRTTCKLAAVKHGAQPSHSRRTAGTHLALFYCVSLRHQKPNPKAKKARAACFATCGPCAFQRKPPSVWATPGVGLGGQGFTLNTVVACATPLRSRNCTAPM